MAKSGRKKNKTHVVDATISTDPKSFVIKTGKVGAVVSSLVRDIRRVMEPNTASRLKERKGNRLRDFVDVAAQLNVTHLLVFAKGDAQIHLRLGRIPRGPTLTFVIESYCLAKDVLALQKRPRSPGSEFKVAPLVVLNNFSDEKHMKLMATSFQNLFPTIRVNQMTLSDAKRVILLNHDPETGLVEFRHYAISVKQVPMDHGRGAFASESDVEDGESTVSVRDSSDKQTDQRSIRLTEMGPRLSLRLLKIEEDLCAGNVIYSSTQ